MSSRPTPWLLVGFVIVTSFLLALIGLVLGRIRIEDTKDYNAVFADASGLKAGVDVRAAGVSIGTVESVGFTDGHAIRVRFSVPSDLALSTRAEARIRWANLTGDRYLEIADDDQNLSAGRLVEHGTIPLSRTQPALDLDTLFNGFKPLTQALDAGELNQFTSNLIAVAQGQGGAIESLIRRIGSLTTALANRDQLIGQVITNFDQAVGTVADRDKQFDQLIVQLRDVLDGLADDRKVIGASVAELDGFSAETAQLLANIRPDVKDLVAETHRLSSNVNRNTGELSKNLDLGPKVIKRLGRVGAYGTFTNFYLCGIRTVSDGPTGDLYTPWTYSNVKRCQP